MDGINDNVGEGQAGVSVAQAWKLMPRGRRIAVVLGLEGLVLVIIYWCVAIYWFNRDFEEMNRYRSAQSRIDNECRRRDDLVPNLTAIAMDYARHERALFRYVSDARSQLEPLATSRDASAGGDIERALSKLIALAEQYPELKATKSFLDLMDMLETTENRIGSMREEYIEAAKDYNLCNQRFWCNFFTWGVAPFMNLPTFVDYFYSTDLSAPQVRLGALSGGDVGSGMSGGDAGLERATREARAADEPNRGGDNRP